MVAVTDGAEWIPGFLEQHCPEAVRILDFPHAAQRLGPIAQAVWGAASEAGRQWVREQTRCLKQEGPAAVLTAIEALARAHPEAEGVAEHHRYLQKREEQMQYPTYRARGWPIGSGAVESANKLVVEARLKGAGMHWERRHVDPLLALRNAVCNDRWAEAWAQIARGLREQASQRQEKRREQRARAAPPVAAPRPPAPAGTTPTEQRPPAAGEHAARQPPAATHPWRRFHLGRPAEPPRAVMMHAKH